MSRQLTLDGSEAHAEAQSRKGCVGKVERYVFAFPWLTVGEIAIKIDEPPARVSNALNVLKHEGRATSERGFGPRGGSVWASTSETCRERRESALASLRVAKEEKVRAKLIAALAKEGVTADPPDWRGTSIGEDYYAL